MTEQPNLFTSLSEQSKADLAKIFSTVQFAHTVTVGDEPVTVRFEVTATVWEARGIPIILDSTTTFTHPEATLGEKGGEDEC